MMYPASYVVKMGAILIITLSLLSPSHAALCPYSILTCKCDYDNIDCANRNLTELPKLQFGSGYSQTELHISGNNIMQILDGQLPHGLEEIESLGNPLTYISPGAFQKVVTSLETIIIEESQVDLDQLSEAIKSLVSLETLSLGHNNISDFGFFSFPKTLTHLFLDDNLLTSAPDISGLYDLQEVDLSHNMISSITTLQLPESLTDLYLSNNNIKVLPIFKAVGGTSVLEVLSLENNPIETIAQDAFSHLPELQRLDLSLTKLTRLPLALQALNSIEEINLSEISTLVCDCAEFALGSWYSGVKSQLNINGNCGASDVAYFLDKLVSQCSAPSSPIG